MVDNVNDMIITVDYNSLLNCDIKPDTQSNQKATTFPRSVAKYTAKPIDAALAPMLAVQKNQ